MQTGTTTVALKFSDGVVLAADRRVSVSAGFVVSRKFQKIVPLDNYVAMTTSGMVADNQKLAEMLKNRIKFFYLSRRRKPTVNEIALYASTVLYSYFRNLMPMIAHIIIAGVDKSGPHIFFLDEVGSVVEDDYLSTGSGSPIAFGYLEGHFREGLSEEEAIRIAVKAINSAIMRDLASGDGIDVVVIKREGLRKLSDEEVKKYLEVDGV